MMFVQFRNTYKILSNKYVIYFYEQNVLFVCVKYIDKIVLSVHKKYFIYNESA